MANLAKSINALFPNEPAEVYYVPAIKKRDSMDGTCGVSRGKLVDKYRNSRTRLRNSGILSKRGVKRPATTLEFEETEGTVVIFYLLWYL